MIVDVLSEYIDKHIDSDELKQKYNAQNIIYILYFNSDETNSVNSWTLSSLSGCPTEVINMFVRLQTEAGYFYMSPSAFAHEILHCFGAPDLYYASEEIPQAYVDHCGEIQSGDIMYTIGIEQEIRQELSEVIAYYVGLIDTCPQIEEWGLGVSSHAANKSK